MNMGEERMDGWMDGWRVQWRDKGGRLVRWNKGKTEEERKIKR